MKMSEVLNVNFSHIWIPTLNIVFYWLWFEFSSLQDALISALSYVSLKNFQKSRQRHTDCICLIFLHCVFSNVSSDRPHVKRHIYIGCICLTFLHCVFSNVTSMHSDQRMHSHIACICLIFLLCAFSDVSSNFLHEKTHSRIYILREHLHLLHFR